MHFIIFKLYLNTIDLKKDLENEARASLNDTKDKLDIKFGFIQICI